MSTEEVRAFVQFDDKEIRICVDGDNGYISQPLTWEQAREFAEDVLNAASWVRLKSGQ